MEEKNRYMFWAGASLTILGAGVAVWWGFGGYDMLCDWFERRNRKANAEKVLGAIRFHVEELQSHQQLISSAVDALVLCEDDHNAEISNIRVEIGEMLADIDKLFAALDTRVCGFPVDDPIRVEKKQLSKKIDEIAESLNSLVLRLRG